MTWDKFKGGMVTLQIKYRLSPLPQSCVQMGVAALPNGMGHLSALRRPEGITRMGGRYVQFQHKAALRQADMLRSKGWNLNALVSCQTILPALIQDRADTSPEGASEKWNVGDRDHKGARFWKVVALQPQVGAWKRGSAVLFCIAQTAVKAVRASIQYKGALKGMRHTENAVPALHGEEAERPHDIGAERRKGAISNFAADAGQLNVAALPGKPASVRLDHTVSDG